MPASDALFVIQWWLVLFFIGIASYPLTKILFSGRSLGKGWYDNGYLFAKAVGMAVIGYGVFLLGTLHIAPFTKTSILFVAIAVFLTGTFFSLHGKKRKNHSGQEYGKLFFLKKRNWKRVLLYFLEELFFVAALFLWAWVKGHEPSIRGLEKFMDFGFMQSALNSRYFPAPDMWWAGGTINYYYFGHFVTALLTKASGIPLTITFNLMLATLFSLTFTMSFSIGYQIRELIGNAVFSTEKRISSLVARFCTWMISLFSGLLTAFLVTLAGNMQTIYVFTKGYAGENVVPFWTIFWPLGQFFEKIGEGAGVYWYANATRFIPFTIHEFPSYSFVVSDVHGHVLSIPFVLLAIGLLIVFATGYVLPAGGQGVRGTGNIKEQLVTRNSQLINLIFYGFLLGVLLMTNALDGPMYGLLFAVLVVVSRMMFQRSHGLQVTSCLSAGRSDGFWKKISVPIVIVAGVAGLVALPFLLHFSSFASGIGVNCPPPFLSHTTIGPFLFEGVEKCQKSPLWMLWLLWGFFWYNGFWLFIRKIWKKDDYNSPIHRILSVFFLFSLALIIIPEFFYVKDIYPAHFRSNTMFKLGYQAFILWSIVSSFVITYFLFRRYPPDSVLVHFPLFPNNMKFRVSNLKQKIRKLFLILLVPQLFLVSLYPLFSVRSYFGELKRYKGLDGVVWLRESYPDDWKIIEWIKDEGLKIKDPKTILPVIVEADGDSYTDYNHISAFSGTPTIVGWAVHEWLWRGSYDVVAPRREDVRRIYEATSAIEAEKILRAYNVSYIVVGTLEREKFKTLNESVFQRIATPVFTSGDTILYQVSKQAGS